MRSGDWRSDVGSSDLVAMERLYLLPNVSAIEQAAGPRITMNSTGRMNRISGTVMIAGRRADRKSVVSGKSVSVRVDLGGRRIIITKTTQGEPSAKPQSSKETCNTVARHVRNNT